MNLSPEHVAFVVSIAVLIGAILPPLQAFVQKPHWSPRTKAILAVVFSVIGGSAGYVVDHGLDFSSPEKVVFWILGVYLAATTLYARLFKPTGVTDKIETSVNSGAPEPRRAADPDGADDGPDDPDPADQVNDDTEPAVAKEGV